MAAMECPCTSGSEYEQCCGPFLEGKESPPTAEQLMRARYTAYTLERIDYVAQTHHPETREQFDQQAALSWASGVDWRGLEIVDTEAGGPTDDEGVVEFIAHFDDKGGHRTHRERSTFRRVDGEWYFYSGRVGSGTVRRERPKVGRNAPCPCGSGKKYKRCCAATA
jgi:SEC-C motif-containing protein